MLQSIYLCKNKLLLTFPGAFQGKHRGYRLLFSAPNRYTRSPNPPEFLQAARTIFKEARTVKSGENVWGACMFC